jgi:signal transduction histidine kinase
MTAQPEFRAGSGNVGEAERAVLVATREGVVLDVSESLCRLFARPAEDMVGQSVAAMGLADEARLRWVLARLPARRHGYRYTTEVDTPEGRRRIVVELHTLQVAGGDVIVAGVRAAEDPATAGDAGVLAMVLDRAPVGVVVCDRDLRIVRVNPLVEHLGRITPAHIGVRLTDAVPDASPAVVGALRDVLETGEARANLEVTGTEGGSFLVTVFPVSEAQGRVEWAGCIFADVSDRVAAERALAESDQHRREILASLLQSEEAERSRIATELHDDTVQVMTAGLLTMDRVELVARKTDNGRLADAVAFARATLEEATDRTRRLMFELRPAILHEHGLGAAVGVLAEQAAREAGATADVDCAVGRYDHAVEELVYRTLQEVLANVRKHAQPSRIRVELDDDGASVRGRVHDDGRGFDVEAVRARPDAPLHLGINALGERVRAAGGEITIDSTPGTGTVVEFTIPLDPVPR